MKAIVPLTFFLVFSGCVEFQSKIPEMCVIVDGINKKIDAQIKKEQEAKLQEEEKAETSSEAQE